MPIKFKAKRTNFNNSRFSNRSIHSYFSYPGRKLTEAEEPEEYFAFLYKDKGGGYHQEEDIYKDLRDALEDKFLKNKKSTDSTEEILAQVKEFSKNNRQTHIIGIADENSVILEPEDLYDDLDECLDLEETAEETAEFFDYLERNDIDPEVWGLFKEDYLGFEEEDY